MLIIFVVFYRGDVRNYKADFEPTYEELGAQNLPVDIRSKTAHQRLGRTDLMGTMLILEREGEHEGIFMSLDPDRNIVARVSRLFATIVIGVSFGWMRVQSGSTAAAALMHAVYNFVLLSITTLQ